MVQAWRTPQLFKRVFHPVGMHNYNKALCQCKAVVRYRKLQAMEPCPHVQLASLRRMAYSLCDAKCIDWRDGIFCYNI